MNSRQKGARGEREFAKFCNFEGYSVRRGQQYNGIEGEDVVGLPGVHVEVKRTERLNIYDAISQAVKDLLHSNNENRLPVVAHRKNNYEWLVTMRLKDWFELYREWETHQKGEGIQNE